MPYCPMFKADDWLETMMRFYLETYGCSLNAADSDMIVGRLHLLGATRVQRIDAADLLIINTCGVKEPTEDRIVYRLTELAALQKPVIVTGCLPKISFNRVVDAIPNFAAILGPQSIDTLGNIVERVMRGERGIVHLKSDVTSKLRFFEGPPDTVVCTVPICEGCLGSCTYCAVRLARSVLRSYTVEEIVSVVTRAVHTGYREIRLTAQDIAAFGRDTGESLVELLTALDAIEGKHRFRLGMFNPNLITDSLDELVKVMRSDHFFKFFHIPLQSGSDAILRAMARRYTVDEWKHVVDTIRSMFPRATIATDIIVGFPGESDNDFDATLRVIQDIRPQVVNISKYGDRPGTKASRSRHKVATSVKKDRSRRLSQMINEMILDEHRQWVGWSGPVLVTGPAPRGGTLCRNQSYHSIIVHDRLNPGLFVDVQIIEAYRSYLLATVTS
ncbi:MAG: tRNA (N(6)-L-threonylcarbamoyladenosine(37)-C(2))-methylthiotransferase [Candidatus Thorarchaeota archaeon]